MKIGDLPKAVRVQNAFSVFEHALTVGRHWKEQEGVNAAYLDALAEAVERYDEELPPAPFIVDTTDVPKSVDQRLAQACRDWHRGVLGRDDFLSSVARLADSTECQACRKTLTYEEAKEHVVDCPGPAEDSSEPSLEYRRGYKEGSRATAHELLSGQRRDDRLRVAIEVLAADIRRRPLPEIGGTEMRCDEPGSPKPSEAPGWECDPSFGCFSCPAGCCKKVSP